MRNICFVCFGNTGRSMMAERLMKKHLLELGIKDVKVSSGGLCVNKGDRMEDKAGIALKQFGIRPSHPLAKQLTHKDLKKDIFFITMTKEQKEAFGRFDNVFSLGELVDGEDILDPYGYDQEVFNKTAAIINEYTYKLAQNLKQ